MEICQVMKLIYKAKWATVILFAITFVASFAVLFVGGTADVNRYLLVADILLIIAQSANVIYALRNNRNDVAITLLVCLLVSLALSNIYLELELYSKGFNCRI